MLVDPDFIDYHDLKKDQETVGTYANKMLREQTDDDGRRITQTRLDEVRGRLPMYLRKHAMGCAEGIIWPTLPAEADLGMHRRLKAPKFEDGEERSAQRTAVERGEH